MHALALPTLKPKPNMKYVYSFCKYCRQRTTDHTHCPSQYTLRPSQYRHCPSHCTHCPTQSQSSVAMCLKCVARASRAPVRNQSVTMPLFVCGGVPSLQQVIDQTTGKATSPSSVLSKMGQSLLCYQSQVQSHCRSGKNNLHCWRMQPEKPGPSPPSTRTKPI